MKKITEMMFNKVLNIQNQIVDCYKIENLYYSKKENEYEAELCKIINSNKEIDNFLFENYRTLDNLSDEILSKFDAQYQKDLKATMEELQVYKENYERTYSNLFEREESPHYFMLKWLIAFHARKCCTLQYTYDTTKSLEDNIFPYLEKFCSKLSFPANTPLTKSTYANTIIDYAQYDLLRKIRFRETKEFNIFTYLLVLYCSSVTYDDTDGGTLNVNNPLGNVIIKIIKAYNDQLHPEPPLEEIYAEYNDPTTNYKHYNICDHVIDILLFWMSDMSLTIEYDKLLEKISSHENSLSHNIDSNKLFQYILCDNTEECNGISNSAMPSQISYYLNDLALREKKAGYKNIKESFCKFMDDMPLTAEPIAPSIITIIINTLIPSKLSRAKNKNFFYKNILRPIHKEKVSGAGKLSKQAINFPAKDDTSFLKMLLIPKPSNTYNKNKLNRIENIFDYNEWQFFCNTFKKLYALRGGERWVTTYQDWYLFKYAINDHTISRNDIRFYEKHILPLILPPDKKQKKKSTTSISFAPLEEKKLAQSTVHRLHRKILKAMTNYSFDFTYDYFRLFLKAFDMLKIDCYKNHQINPNIAFSILHLNSFTKWFDALLLHHRMPYWAKDCPSLFYTKLMLCDYNCLFEKYSDKKIVNAIKKLSRIKINDLSSMFETCHIDAYKRHGKEPYLSKDPLSKLFVEDFYQLTNPLLNDEYLLDLFRDSSIFCTVTDKNCGNDYSLSYEKDLSLTKAPVLDPIYKWIKSIEYEDVPENFYDELGCPPKRKKKSVWVKPDSLFS